jgi:phenylpropionate dioxygenase-like ring-hydroxylating dioxygenase large terminal subunit
MLLLLLLLYISITYSYINNWFPVISISNTDFTNPIQLRILSKDFVIWKKEDKLVFQDDICPHRCAPLSEGYIDKKSNNLRCAYHGWEFNEDGNCTIIPQVGDKYILKSKCNVKNYHTCIHGDLLWVFLGNEQIYYTPADKYDIQDSSIFMRDLPYSKYILLENFFDPAHIPFAHHNLQSHRDKACPITVEKLSKKYDKNKLSILFTEKNETKIVRIGMMTFEMPCYYYLKTIHPRLSFLEGIHLFMVPVQLDKTRLFIAYEFNKKNKFYKIFNMIPTWVRHAFTNRFLDSDTLILNKQEKYILSKNDSYHYNKQYKMPTTSDASIKMYKKWIKWVLPEIPYYNKIQRNNALSRKEILDRYEQHTKYCKSCKNALKNINTTKYVFSIWSGIFFIYTRKIIFLILSFISYNICKKLEQSFYFQDYIHNEIN